MKKPLIIGITGGSGSGKTFVLKQLVKALGSDKTAVISQDNYYKPINEQQQDDSGIENFDLPNSIDQVAFANDILQLCKGQSISRHEYLYNNAQKEAKTITIQPSLIIIVEGIFVISHQNISCLIDYKVFIDCPNKIMF